MLKTFIRFTETDIDPEAENTCQDTESCENEFTYNVPAVSGDVIKWQILESQVPSVYDIADLRIGLTDECGNIIAQDIGTIIEAGDGLLQCEATIEAEMGCYKLIIYADFSPIEDCSIFAGSTLQDLIDSGLLFGQTLQCIPVPDWE